MFSVPDDVSHQDWPRVQLPLRGGGQQHQVRPEDGEEWRRRVKKGKAIIVYGSKAGKDRTFQIARDLTSKLPSVKADLISKLRRVKDLIPIL